MHYEKLNEKDSVINASTDFWIGDPCYVVPDDQWTAFCDNMFAYEKRDENKDLPRCYISRVEHEETGYVFHTWSTAYGDGSYHLMINNDTVSTLCVDAGTLSVIPVGLIEHWKKQGEIGNYEDLGHVVKAEHLQGELTCHNGDMSWGDVLLPTSGTDEDEEEDPWGECEDEGFFS